jgi:hypothetical protein
MPGRSGTLFAEAQTDSLLPCFPDAVAGRSEGCVGAKNGRADAFMKVIRDGDAYADRLRRSRWRGHDDAAGYHPRLSRLQDGMRRLPDLRLSHGGRRLQEHGVDRDEFLAALRAAAVAVMA